MDCGDATVQGGYAPRTHSTCSCGTDSCSAPLRPLVQTPEPLPAALISRLECLTTAFRSSSMQAMQSESSVVPQRSSELASKSKEV